MQLLTSVEGEEEATSNPKWGEGGATAEERVSVGTGERGINTTADPEKAVKPAQWGRDNDLRDFPDPTLSGSFDSSPSLETNLQSPTVRAAESACRSPMLGASCSSRGGGPNNGT